MDLLSLMPSDTPPYMADAWVGCMSWAIGDAEVVAMFREETGNQWRPGNGIVAMIDKATGADAAFIKQFVEWANVNIWGPIDTPAAAL